MRRCYVPPEQWAQDTVSMTGDEHRHVVRVLRLQVGDPLLLCDGQGGEAASTITRIDKRSVEVTVSSRQCLPRPSHAITLFQGLPKANHWEWIIQKTTELGITRLVPVLCTHSVPRFDANSMEKHLRRWRRIADEASKQCERAHFPTVDPPIPWLEAIEAFSPPGILFWEREAERSLRALIPTMPSLTSASLFVGPEGGFTPEEVTQARDAGIHTVSLGKNILRTETAAVIGTALMLYELGELGRHSPLEG